MADTADETPEPPRPSAAGAGGWSFLDVAGRLAHEVRNPLTAVEMSTHVLAAALADLQRPDLEDLACEVRDASRRMSLSVDELVEFSRVAAGALNLRREPVRLSDIADEALRGARLYRPDGIAYREAVDRADLAGAVDRPRLVLVLRNLVRYLLDYGQPPVRVLVGRDERNLLFRIEDSGPGLSAEERYAALERLQAGPEVGAAFGAGLGLFLCLPIIEAHQGSLQAIEQDDGSTAFVIRLPAQGEIPTRD